MDSNGNAFTSQILLLVTSLAFSAFVYWLFMRRVSSASSLREAKKVSLDQNLPRILADAPGKRIPYAAIEGVVLAVDKTIDSEFVDSCQGVVTRWTLTEKIVAWDQAARLWLNSENVIDERTKFVPFDLVSHCDAFTTTVRVVFPLDAELDMEKTSHRIQLLRHGQKGNHTVIEEMLQDGARITGVGELVLEGGMLFLQAPERGFRYILSSLDYDTLLETQKSKASFYGGLLALVYLAACVTLVFILY